ncbi:hypothetical protein HJC10_09930 [Corallococcus exiguus]|nr:hypothetical protein [Corallococcus exiguus]
MALVSAHHLEVGNGDAQGCVRLGAGVLLVFFRSLAGRKADQEAKGRETPKSMRGHHGEANVPNLFTNQSRKNSQLVGLKFP